MDERKLDTIHISPRSHYQATDASSSSFRDPEVESFLPPGFARPVGPPLPIYIHHDHDEKNQNLQQQQQPTSAQSNSLLSSSSSSPPATTSALALSNSTNASVPIGISSSSRLLSPSTDDEEEEDLHPRSSRVPSSVAAVTSNISQTLRHSHVNGNGNGNGKEDGQARGGGGGGGGEQVDPDVVTEEAGEDGDANEAGENGTDDEDKPIDKGELFTRPLLYYRRSAGGARKVNNADNPVQILLPHSYMSLGFPPVPSTSSSSSPSRSDAAEESKSLESLVVFSSPNEEQVSRTKVFACLLYFLLPADLILISTIYFRGSATSGSSGDFSDGQTDSLTYACTVVELFLGLLGMRLHDTRVITLFVVIFYIDSLINLIRVYSVLQFSHFVLQLAICHVMTQFKLTLLPSWFAPLT